MAKILDELILYTETHFRDEEGLLADRRYSDIATHKHQHAGFVKQVQDLRGQFAAGRITMSIQTLQFLKSWLTTHILSADQAYARELAR
jgi:hemerythrin